MSKRHIEIAGHKLHLPRSKAGRVALGGGLMLGGVLGFLPVLGFWMVPLGVVVLSHDLPVVRRLKRRAQLRWGRSDLRAWASRRQWNPLAR